MALKKSLEQGDDVYWVETEDGKGIPFTANLDGAYLYRGEISYKFDNGRYYIGGIDLLYTTDDEPKSKYDKDPTFFNQDVLFSNFEEAEREMIRQMFAKEKWL
jgi:hypothetical protein